MNTEGMTGIEPALSAWEAEVLPLNYIPDCTPEGCAVQCSEPGGVDRLTACC